MKKAFYVTTPIYYVNDVPHIGHAYTTVAADVITRFKRLSGQEVFFLTGTDEHGQKIERTAKEVGERPIELADRVVTRFKELWRRLEVTNSDFIRTTEERHKWSVTELFRRVRQKGDIYPGEYEDWYCVYDETFWTETQLAGERACPDCKRPLERVKEESYFFRLSRYQKPLLDYIEKNPDFVQPPFRRNEVVSFIEGGLRDLSVSRTSFSWGIPVPGDPRHVIYVWFDALTNYITAAGFPDNMSRFEEVWPADVHLVGKDILRFHAVYWPAFLMSAGLPPPRSVFAHGWWTVEGEKMSKSKGNVVDPNAVIDEFGSDAFRYFILREVPFGLDGDFSRSALIGRINGDLANGLGNLVSRSLGMLERYSEGKVPNPGELKSPDIRVREKASETIRSLGEAMNEFAFHKALVSVFDFIGFVNKYVDESAPWSLAKDPKDKSRLNTVLWTLVESLRTIAILIAPFMPASAKEIWRRIGAVQSFDCQNLFDARVWGGTKPGWQIEKGEPLFPRYKE